MIENIFKKKEALSFQGFLKEFEKERVAEESSDKLVSRPKVSVILIAFEHEAYVQRALLSILSQKTSFEYEVIVADDASTDSTAAIVRQHLKNSPERLRFFQHQKKNKIKVQGVKCGIYQIAYSIYVARGEYFCLLSGDDWWGDNDKLDKQVSFMEAHSECAVSYHDWRFYLGPENKLSSKKQNLRVATAMFRGKITRLPRQFLSVLNEDTFLFNCYRKVGWFRYLNNMGPSVCRIHERNLWGKSRTDSNYQSLHRANTRLNFLMAVKHRQWSVADMASLPKLIYQTWPESKVYIRSKAMCVAIFAGFILWPLVLLAREVRGAFHGKKRIS